MNCCNILKTQPQAALLYEEEETEPGVLAWSTPSTSLFRKATIIGKSALLAGSSFPTQVLS